MSELARRGCFFRIGCTTWRGIGLCLLGAVLAAPQAAGDLLASDGFENYAIGSSLSGGSGGEGWSGAWHVAANYAGKLTVVEGGLSYHQGDFAIDGGDRALQITGAVSGTPTVAQRTFESTTDTVYMSMLFQTTTATGDKDDDFVQFGLDDRFDHPRASIGHRANNAVDDHDFFARTTNNHGQSTFTGGAGGDLLTHLLIARVTRTQGGQYDQVELWVDPTSLDLGAADAIQTYNTGLAAVDRFVMRLAYLEGGDRYVIDELRVGSGLSQVIGASAQVIPEPATLVMAAMGLAAVMRRPRRGT
jgi:hypothetical protein